MSNPCTSACRTCGQPRTPAEKAAYGSLCENCFVSQCGQPDRDGSVARTLGRHGAVAVPLRGRDRQ